MILHACIDDSATRPGREPAMFLLGGILSSVENWQLFSDEWSAKISEPPGLKYFKLSQCLAMRDEFDKSRGWTCNLRDQRLLDLAAIVNTHAIRGVLCAINSDDYKTFVGQHSMREEFRDPYFLCFWWIIQLVTRARETIESVEDIRYFFDEQGITGMRPILWWQQIKKAAPAEFSEMLGSTPKPENDKDFSPLQAADLFVGLSRLKYEKGDEANKHILDAQNVFAKLRTVRLLITANDLKTIGDSFRSYALQAS